MRPTISIHSIPMPQIIKYDSGNIHSTTQNTIGNIITQGVKTKANMDQISPNHLLIAVNQKKNIKSHDPIQSNTPTTLHIVFI